MYKNNTGNLLKVVEHWRTMVSTCRSYWRCVGSSVAAHERPNGFGVAFLALSSNARGEVHYCKNIKIHLQSFDSLFFLCTDLRFFFDSPLYKF
jgi:hypothetical protein